MSNLKFPIDALKLTLTIISSGNPMSTEGLKSRLNQMDGMQRAISILRVEKRRDEKRESVYLEAYEKVYEKKKKE